MGEGCEVVKRMRDPKVIRLRKRIELVGSPKMADRGRGWQGTVEITLRDGRTIEHHTRAARGSFSNPLTREEGPEKALGLLAPVLGAKRACSLIAAVWRVESLKDARTLGTLCRPA